MANLVRWEPYRDLISLREAMSRIFEESFVQPRTGWLAPFGPVGERTLAVNMYETDDAIVVRSAIPGLKPDDLDISVTGDTLTIKGESKVEEDVKEEHYIRRERRYGSFCRALTIPVQIVADKAEEVKPKAIKVKAKGKQ